MSAGAGRGNAARGGALMKNRIDGANFTHLFFRLAEHFLRSQNSHRTHHR
jgi:hypothetical protein